MRCARHHSLPTSQSLISLHFLCCFVCQSYGHHHASAPCGNLSAIWHYSVTCRVTNSRLVRPFLLLLGWKAKYHPQWSSSCWASWASFSYSLYHRCWYRCRVYRLPFHFRFSSHLQRSCAATTFLDWRRVDFPNLAWLSVPSSNPWNLGSHCFWTNLLPVS